MGHIRIRLSQRQAKELLKQFEKDSEFNVYKNNNSEFYTIIPKQGGTIIDIYKDGKKYILQIFS